MNHQPKILVIEDEEPMRDLYTELLVDAGYQVETAKDGEQALDVDNTLVNTTLFTYEIPVPTSKDECKNDGWMTMGREDGSAFKNQGDCVSFVANGK